MINKNSSEPMYAQIACILRKEITQKAAIGTIGTHGDLAKRFDVSLITIRKAIELLIKEDLLVAKPGKGTFIKRQPLQDGFNRLTGMSTVIAMNNLKADVLVTEMSYTEPPAGIPENIKTELGERCLFIERTHSISGKVIGMAHIYIPNRYAKHFSLEDVSQHTIYYQYENKLDIRLGKGLQYITAAPASPRVSEILKIAKKSPVLMLERFSYSIEGQLLEYMLVYYEHSQYSFKVELDLFAE